MKILKLKCQHFQNDMLLVVIYINNLLEIYLLNNFNVKPKLKVSIIFIRLGAENRNAT